MLEGFQFITIFIEGIISFFSNYLFFLSVYYSFDSDLFDLFGCICYNLFSGCNCRIKNKNDTISYFVFRSWNFDVIFLIRVIL